MTDEKKKRGTSFTIVEKENLKQLIMIHKDIVENRKSDGVTIKEKNEAWAKIQQEFNSIPEHSNVSYH